MSDLAVHREVERDHRQRVRVARRVAAAAAVARRVVSLQVVEQGQLQPVLLQTATNRRETSPVCRQTQRTIRRVSFVSHALFSRILRRASVRVGGDGTGAGGRGAAALPDLCPGGQTYVFAPPPLFGHL